MAAREASRADRFEDEKKRIIESCFAKKDEDGSILETYITHIKITEYSSYPTGPPPPQARAPQTQKPRVIIVAVRKSGRVRVHKSKENPNGTYSIGKTWNLDDLTAIESYTSASLPPDLRQWAGAVGFVVSLGKPYYWEAQTDKEKKFFIASLLKIYGKYTGGRVPSLSGFDQQELDQILGGVQKRGGSQPPPQPAPAAAPVIPPPRPQAVESIASQSNLSVSSGGYSAPNTAPEPRAASRAPFSISNAPASPAASIDSGRSANQAALRRLAGSNKSQDSVAASTIRSDDASSIPPRSRNGPVNGTNAFGQMEPPPPAPVPAPGPSSEERPPERKRPPMDPARPQGANDEGLVPAPLMSSMRTRERDPVVPPRNSDRMSPRKPPRGEVPPVNERISTPVSDQRTATETPPPAKPPTNGLVTNVSVTSTTSTPRPSTPQTPVEAPKEPEDEDTRPGLGPMIKKKSRGDIAGAFWKAASAATSFKPRPGGAGERLRQAVTQAKVSEGPDGITGVVPAPPRPVSIAKSRTDSEERPKTPQRTSGVPEVKVTVPHGSRPSSLQGSQIPSKEAPKPAQPEPANESRRSVIAGNDVKYLATLGVDTSLMNNKSAEFTKWLDYFGWVPGHQMRSRNYEDMKVDIERELNKAQAGGWLARFEEEDDRVGAIKKGIDESIAECEELDNLLTLYSVELSTLSDDIAYIEAQGQGLQVQASNQKLLKKELESLLDICAITSDDLQALRAAPLENSAGIEEIENALVTLFKAMMKIDPSMGSGEPRASEDTSGDQIGLNSDFGKMRIVQEKKEMYLTESSTFMRRLVTFMSSQIDTACAATRRAMEGALAKKVDPRNHDAGRELLWKYSPLILYARDVDLDNWNRVIQVYQDKSFPVYKSEFREALEAWRRNSRKPTGEEAELLFTYQQEKKEEGIATAARKLTVKRSQTLARSLRSPLGDGSRTNVDKTADSRSLPYEVFAGVLDELLPLVEMEQNFVIDFFHATTLEQSDFTDVVAASRPRDRRGGDLKRHRLMEPDRELARRVTRAMEVIFSFLEQDLQNLIDWVLSIDPLQGIGLLAVLERKLTDMGQSNQDFLNTLLQKLHGNLEGRFRRFVDEQIRAIEETKVKIKKRKGVISFMRTFPPFLLVVENMLVGVEPNSGTRRTIDREYDRVLRSMFESLKVIARENPAVSVGGAGSADPEDKEALNFHILLIENMNHYLEEVENPRGIEVLDEWRNAAAAELAEHMNLYLNAVMRRPLGKLLEHLENVEAQLAAGKSAGGVAAQASNSKAIFNKVLGAYDAKEVRKGIETLRKRVEKHFGDADDPNLSRNLVNRVVKECERFYGEVELRISNVITNVYGGDVLFEWPRAEVKGAFSSR